MPSTPYIGLSVIIHIAIIIAYWIIRFFSRGKKNEKVHRAYSNNFISFAIILFVSVIIFYGISSVVYVSVTNEHSTIRLARNYFSKTPAIASHSSVLANETEIKGDASVQRSIVPDDCLGPFNKLAIVYHGSIVNYLMTKKYDYSFKARKNLASDFGITNYLGTYSQNRILLMRLFVKFEELPDLDGPLCDQM